MRPATGVRYELVLTAVEGAAARYAATVYVPTGEGRAMVRIDASGATVEGSAEGIEAAQLAQLVAIAKTLGRRAAEGWPRRILRWRAPGVR